MPRSGTQNEPRELENEHTTTVNTSHEGAHFNKGYGTAKSGIKLSRTHRTYARERTKTDRVTVPKCPKPKQHKQQGVTDRKPTRKCATLWLVSCKDCALHADLQHAAAARRRSTLAQQPHARPEVSIVKKRRKKCKCHVSCQCAFYARTCDDRYAAAPTSSSTTKWKAQKTLVRAVPSGRSSHSLTRRAACPGIGESSNDPETAFGKVQTGNGKLETRNRKPEAAKARSGSRGPPAELGNRKPKTGSGNGEK